MSSSAKKNERPSPPDGSCHFYVERKRRYCRFQPAKAAKFCAEHTKLYQSDSGKKRVLCPYDSKHTCYETKLNHHMKKCPSRPGEMPPYYSEGINSGDNAEESVPEPKASVLTESLDAIENIIERVEKLHKEHIGRLEESILNHPCMKDELKKKDYGTSALRQRKQQASLIGHMEEGGMLRDNTCFLEMGAGKGQMSHWLHAAVETKKNIGFVLIERSHVRNKMDNLHKEDEAGHVMERVKIDIEHLKLDKVPTIEDHDRQVVAIGKHLCGGATDLALRCVVETLPDSLNNKDQESEGSQRKRLKSEIKTLSGVCIAVCCHHRCTWTPYVGKQFFKACGFSAKDFQIISSMSSWATCAWKGWSYQKKCEKERKMEMENFNGQTIMEQANSDNGKSEVLSTDMSGQTDNTGTNSSNTLNTKDEADNDNTDKSDSTDKSDNFDEEHTPAEDFINARIQDKLSTEEREGIGRKCKQLIDFGRVQYLKEHGMTSSLKLYIEEFFTPENVVLLATSK